MEKYILVPIMRKGLWGLTCDQAQLYHRSYPSVYVGARNQRNENRARSQVVGTDENGRSLDPITRQYSVQRLDAGDHIASFVGRNA